MRTIKHFVLAACAALGVSIAVAQTVTIPSQTFTVVIPAQTVVITLPVQTVPVTAVSVVVTPPPAAGTSWVYHAGVFSWPGDWSYGGTGASTAPTINYKDTAGGGSPYDISVTAVGQWSAWQPYAPNDGPPTTPGGTYLTPSFNTTGYSKLTLSLKPTQPGQKWSLYADVYTTANGSTTGDVSPGAGISDISSYCGPAITVGVWSTCVIPLSAFSAANLTNLYKIGLQDQSGLTKNVFYINDVGFIP